MWKSDLKKILISGKVRKKIKFSQNATELSSILSLIPQNIDNYNYDKPQKKTLKIQHNPSSIIHHTLHPYIRHKIQLQLSSQKKPKERDSKHCSLSQLIAIICSHMHKMK